MQASCKDLVCEHSVFKVIRLMSYCNASMDRATSAKTALKFLCVKKFRTKKNVPEN